MNEKEVAHAETCPVAQPDFALTQQDIDEGSNYCNCNFAQRLAAVVSPASTPIDDPTPETCPQLKTAVDMACALKANGIEHHSAIERSAHWLTRNVPHLYKLARALQLIARFI